MAVARAKGVVKGLPDRLDTAVSALLESELRPGPTVKQLLQQCGLVRSETCRCGRCRVDGELPISALRDHQRPLDGKARDGSRKGLGIRAHLMEIAHGRRAHALGWCVLRDDRPGPGIAADTNPREREVEQQHDDRDARDAGRLVVAEPPPESLN
jgi:hypothetical protein